MKPVFQTRKGKGGNCFAACVASIFEEPLENIDALIDVDDDDGSDWLSGLHEFLKDRGLSLVYAPINDGILQIMTGFTFPCIIAVETKKGMPHAIVGEIQCVGSENVLRPLHDPEPKSSGVERATGIWFFAKNFQKSVDK